jgi:hypothetical protein
MLACEASGPGGDPNARALAPRPGPVRTLLNSPALQPVAVLDI